MLIFSRRIGQALTIGEDIALTVVGIDREETRIRVDVPKTSFTLATRVGQPLNIGEVATATVLVIRSTEIRVGIETGADVPVHRLEKRIRPGLHGHAAFSQV